MKSRVALCYFGNCGWELEESGEKKDLHPSKCFESVKRNIKSKNNIDIFVHSWSKNQEDKILKELSPVKYIFDDQKYFYDLVEARGQKIKSFACLKDYIRDKIKRIDKREYTNRAYSRWYSTKKVIELKSEYEKTNSFTYDFVMLLRMDVEFYNKIHFDLYDPNKFYAGDPSNLYYKMYYYLMKNHNELIRDIPKIRKIKKLSYKIYEFLKRFDTREDIFKTQPNLFSALKALIGFNQYHLSDTWFFSGSSIMNEFSMLFDSAGNYNPSPHISSYQHLLNIISKDRISFPLIQFEDYELYRQGKNTKNKHLIQRWLNEVL